jgi:cyclohexyl-isocyanide hydratase
VTSVCTGALVLGAAGLLEGKRATTHWMSHDMLLAFGATPVAERVVIDGNLITGGGVTAGIDFALRVAAEAFGEDVAKSAEPRPRSPRPWVLRLPETIERRSDQSQTQTRTMP